MSRIRLYLDEGSMRRTIVFGLRARGADVLTAAEAGMVNRADAQHLGSTATPRQGRRASQADANHGRALRRGNAQPDRISILLGLTVYHSR